MSCELFIVSNIPPFNSISPALTRKIISPYLKNELTTSGKWSFKLILCFVFPFIIQKVSDKGLFFFCLVIIFFYQKSRNIYSVGDWYIVECKDCLSQVIFTCLWFYILLAILPSRKTYVCNAGNFNFFIFTVVLKCLWCPEGSLRMCS